MLRVDRPGGNAFLQTWSLGGKGRRVKSDLQAGPCGCKAVKCLQHEVVQHRLERDRGMFRQRIPQRQRAMCRQFGDEPVRQRVCRVLVVLFALSQLTGNRDNRTVRGSRNVLAARR